MCETDGYMNKRYWGRIRLALGIYSLDIRGVTRHLAHETRRIARLGPPDETSRETRCHMYPINNEHKCTLMNTNVIKHVNMVIIITFNIWHLTYIKFTLDLPRVR